MVWTVKCYSIIVESSKELYILFVGRVAMHIVHFHHTRTPTEGTSHVQSTKYILYMVMCMMCLCHIILSLYNVVLYGTLMYFINKYVLNKCMLSYNV